MDRTSARVTDLPRSNGTPQASELRKGKLTEVACQIDRGGRAELDGVTVVNCLTFERPGRDLFVYCSFNQV